MTTYDNPSRSIYNWNALTLTNAFSKEIIGPKGKRGRVIRALMSVTTTIVSPTPAVLTVTTTQSPIPSSPSAPTPSASTVVLNYSIPPTVAPSALATDSLPNSAVRDANYNYQVVPADAPLVVAISAASGTSAAGVIDLELEIDWF